MTQSLEILFIYGFFICISISLLLILFRLMKAPSLADRVIAIELFSTSLISAICVAAIYVDEETYFDVAVVISLFGFLASVIFARFIQSQERLK
jgi:multicomponent Na+:H+ antiporter subunit F